MKTNELELARNRAIAFADRVHAANCCCTHGHFGCSDVEGGFCKDEMFARLGLDNDGDWIDEAIAEDTLGIGEDGLLDQERDL